MRWIKWFLFKWRLFWIQYHFEMARNHLISSLDVFKKFDDGLFLRTKIEINDVVLDLERSIDIIEDFNKNNLSGKVILRGKNETGL